MTKPTAKIIGQQIRVSVDDKAGVNHTVTYPAGDQHARRIAVRMLVERAAGFSEYDAIEAGMHAEGKLG